MGLGGHSMEDIIENIFNNFHPDFYFSYALSNTATGPVIPRQCCAVQSVDEGGRQPYAELSMCLVASSNNFIRLNQK